MKHRHVLKKTRSLRPLIYAAAALTVLAFSVLFLATSTVYADYDGREYYIESDTDVTNGVLQYPSSATSGEYVTVTADPDAGCVTASLTVLMDDEMHLYEYSEEVPDITHPDPNTITFRMPNANVKVVAKFSERDYQRIFICDMEGGTVLAEPGIAPLGETVTLTIQPDNGYAYVPGSLQILEVEPERKEEHEVPEYAVTTLEENAKYSIEVFTTNWIYVRAEFSEVQEETKYQVSVDNALEHGSLSVDQELAAAGWTVTVTAHPDTNQNFALMSLTVTGPDGQVIETASSGSDKYTFTMPEGDVFITAVFDVPVFGITAVSEDVNVPEGRETGCRVDVPEDGEAGSPVSPTLILMDGMELVELVVKGDLSGTVIPCTLTNHEEGSVAYQYTFTMPSEPVTVTARFTVKRYTVRVSDAFEGTLTIASGGASAKAELTGVIIGDTVELTAAVPSGLKLKSFKYTFLRKGEETTINLDYTEKGSNCTAEFIMPDSDVTVLLEALPEISTWQELQQAFDNATYKQKITLYCDITAEASDSALVLETGKEITLDLNGHTLNRNLTSAKNNGFVLWVKDDAILTLRDSSGDDSGTITGGYASGDGGGIYAMGRFEMYGGTISGNKAERGGGVHATNGHTFLMYGGIICNNEAKEGGGVYVGPKTTFDANAGIIRENKATAGGGGIALDGGVLIAKKNLLIQWNTATNGGGICRMNGNAVWLEGCRIIENIASQNGGGLATISYNGVVHCEDAVFDGNKAKSGGAVHLDKDVQAHFANTTFQDNQCFMYGAGLYISENGHNYVYQYPNNNYVVDPEQICTVYDCTFLRNVAGKEGGGIHTVGKLTLYDTTFDSNRAGNYGGGILVYVDMQIDHCQFKGNQATRGAGIGQCGNTTLKVTRSSFVNNRAEEHGGGYWMISSTLTNTVAFEDCTFTENTAGYGAALHTDGAGSMTLKGCVIRNNRAVGRGGALYAQTNGLRLVLIDTDIQGNYAVNEGGGILAEGTSIIMKGLVNIINNQSETKDYYHNLCLGENSYILTPMLYDGSHIKVTTSSKRVFAKDVSEFQKRYFKADRGKLVYTKEGEISTPIFASLFGQGSWIVIASILGAAILAVAAVILVKSLKRKEKTDENEES